MISPRRNSPKEVELLHFTGETAALVKSLSKWSF
ncbi:hypothetical protein GBAR_LOCUS19298 [Geodia barretti]|uniref:Uncharacterized protein n=1 Tax=Geodia barretti TaxID=519541 RepID=A0AA35WVE2_GEOBA|nr:hypothetical protein GBAR_LOCUS19298 [Geodia barretti]